MPYHHIALDQATVPEPIRAYIADRVDPFLSDVRWMLTAPGYVGGPALNWSIAVVLFTVIGGLSRIFYNDDTVDNIAFRNAAARYPLSVEPVGAIDPDEFPGLLYSVYRNGLIHSSGIHVAQDKRTKRWAFNISHERYVVARTHQGIPRTEAELDALDSSVRMVGLPATLARIDGKVRLDVDSLYWGVRQLVRTLATDQALHQVALEFLTPWAKAKRSDYRFEFGAAMSTGAVSVGPTWTAVESTAGPMSAVRSTLNDE